MITSRPMGHALRTEICRFTAIDKVALGFAAAFLFVAAAVAICAYVAIGDAPEGRMWAFLLSWAAIGLGASVVVPWALCRALHAATFTARIAWNQRATHGEMQPLTPFLQSRAAA